MLSLDCWDCSAICDLYHSLKLSIPMISLGAFSLGYDLVKSENLNLIHSINSARI